MKLVFVFCCQFKSCYQAHRFSPLNLETVTITIFNETADMRVGEGDRTYGWNVRGKAGIYGLRVKLASMCF
tara:strand:- start:26141 stop:26353 length:213 start_codon:yes stop_codon:yes gene_type:complete